MAFDIPLKDSPSFYKIIIDFMGDLQKLGIPKKFMEMYGTNLSDIVTLKTPNDKSWKIGMLRVNGRVWLNDGWLAFVKYYSMSHGHFLMFTYEGMSQFNVIIFNKSASEIEYPLDLEETWDVQNRLRKVGIKNKNSIAPTSSEKGKKMMIPIVPETRRKFGGKARNLTEEEIKLIHSCQSESPSFAALMQPSYVNFKFCMNVPKKFMDEYLTIGKIESFILQNENGRTWPVRCVGKCKIKFTSGWKDFALDNNLRVGDVCVFTLIKVVIKATKYLFKVKILKSSSSSRDAGSSCPKTTISEGNHEVISIDD